MVWAPKDAKPRHDWFDTCLGDNRKKIKSQYFISSTNSVDVFTKQPFRNEDDDDDDDNNADDNDNKMIKMSARKCGPMCAKPFTCNMLSILAITPQCKYLHYSRSTDEKTEAK